MWIIAVFGACSGSDPTADDTADDGLPEVITIADDTLFPESGAWDADRRAFFVGSLSRGTISQVELDGSLTTWVEDAGWGQVRGIKIGGGRLWACATGGGVGHIAAFDLADATRVVDVDLSTVVEDASCNDLALDDDGGAWVTDELRGKVYRVTADGSAAIWAEGPLLEGGLVGLNGITRVEGAVLADRYTFRKLVRIVEADPSVITEVSIEGDLPNLGGGRGFDGMLAFGGAVYVAAVGPILRFTSGDGWATTTLSTITLPGEGWSALTVADDAVYAIKSDPLASILGLEPDLPFEIRRVPTP